MLLHSSSIIEPNATLFVSVPNSLSELINVGYKSVILFASVKHLSISANIKISEISKCKVYYSLQLNLINFIK